VSTTTCSDLSLLKADALWYENKRCSDSNPWPMNPKASVLHYTTAPHKSQSGKIFRIAIILFVKCASGDHICNGFACLSWYLFPVVTEFLTKSKVIVLYSYHNIDKIPCKRESVSRSPLSGRLWPDLPSVGRLWPDLPSVGGCDLTCSEYREKRKCEYAKSLQSPFKADLLSYTGSHIMTSPRFHVRCV